jgi:hypothetical protein
VAVKEGHKHTIVTSLSAKVTLSKLAVEE